MRGVDGDCYGALAGVTLMMPELMDIDPSEIDEACEVLASYIRVVPVIEEPK